MHIQKTRRMSPAMKLMTSRLNTILTVVDQPNLIILKSMVFLHPRNHFHFISMESPGTLLQPEKILNLQRLSSNLR